MQKLYTDPTELRNDIVKAYEKTDRLSRSQPTETESKHLSSQVCLYSNRENGVGCAMGAVIESQEVAEVLDNMPYSSSIKDLYRFYIAPEEYAETDLDNASEEQKAAIKYLFTEIFDMSSLTIDDLVRMQTSHDNAHSKEHFLQKLNSLSL